ncbi:MAG: sulfate reduction electron transfer complex DsrMKJOP subunit DsrO [Acidithiobacillales bacterium]
MGEDRRTFLKRAGVAALVAAGGATLFRFDDAVEASTGEAPKGVRRAMVVDLRKCLEKDDCTACTEACRKVHNVPSIPDPKHEVKWIWQEPFRDVFPDEDAPYVDEALTARSALTFCNHCDNPPCARVCPTQATWKRPDGIVMMDWHRCIGCRYCMAACPYGSRSFNWLDPRPYIKELNRDFPTRTKGVVEKCTFCDELVDKGQPPACVAACKEKAMTFGDLNDPGSEVRRLLKSRFAIRRKPGLGTQPEVYYLV